MFREWYVAFQLLQQLSLRVFIVKHFANHPQHDVYELAEGVIVWLGTSETDIDYTGVKELMSGLEG